MTISTYTLESEIFDVRNFHVVEKWATLKQDVCKFEILQSNFGTNRVKLHTGCLSQLDYYSNYKTHRAFKNVFSLIFFTSKKLFCMFTMFSSWKSLKKSIFKCPVRFVIWVVVPISSDTLYVHPIWIVAVPKTSSNGQSTCAKVYLLVQNASWGS